MQPCKSVIANASLIYHSAMLGLLSFGIDLWKNNFSVDTHVLELRFALIPLISHILMLVWIMYKLSKYLWQKVEWKQTGRVHCVRRHDDYL